MKKKILILLISIILIVGIAITIYILNNTKENKANKIFGQEYCDVIIHMATRDLAEHECRICEEKFQDSSMREDICDNCAKQTNRCEFCGKKLNSETQNERNNLK